MRGLGGGPVAAGQDHTGAITAQPSLIYESWTRCCPPTVSLRLRCLAAFGCSSRGDPDGLSVALAGSLVRALGRESKNLCKMEIESPSPIGGEATMDATSRSTKYFRALFLEGEMSRLIRYDTSINAKSAQKERCAQQLVKSREHFKKRSKMEDDLDCI